MHSIIPRVLNLKEKLISYYMYTKLIFSLPKSAKMKKINENANLFLQIENEDDEMTRSTTTTSRSLNIQDPVPAEGGTSSFIFSEKIDDLTILYICLAGVLVLLSVLLVILIYV